MFSIKMRHLPVIALSIVIYFGIFLLGVYIFNVNQSSANLIAFLWVASFLFFLENKINLNLESVRLPHVSITLLMIAVSLIMGKLSDHLDPPPIHTAIYFSIAIAIYSGLSRRIYSIKK
ncbi:hypothetical protein ASE99_10115 [Serratia sp. Leaf51]|nr:hypothetical protein ASE99_10115 [Serratia sp. Leaf51]